MEGSGRKIKMGVCVMEKKLSSMGPILERFESFGEFEIIIFGDKVIKDDPIDCWPIVDCLIAFYSTGFPLKKAEQYVELRQPFLFNALGKQHLLLDRREVLKVLDRYGIPVPKHVVVNRASDGQDLNNFTEEDDAIIVDGERLSKPFVEKPTDSEDHRVMIYYPSSAGGGRKELFRKVGNESSKFYPERSKVRRDVSYIYEEFISTGGTDVKVYTVGPNYIHAEARKSPAVDGIVNRNPDGKEVRYPVLLTPAEKKIAGKVCMLFEQLVCGLDLLRCGKRKFYVCDVNGWSFVKNSNKYYDDAALKLRELILGDVAPHLLSSTIPPSVLGHEEPHHLPEERTNTEELICVIAVIRHGDRTPKQKIKIKVREEELLELMLKYNGGKTRTQTKLKSGSELRDLLDAVRGLVPHSRSDRESDIDVEDFEHAQKLLQVKEVLEKGGHFSGIYRKAQLKPLKWDEKERPVEALLVLKYGGILTHAGKKQAEELGRYFRSKMYSGNDLLRLHSTFHHNLKIWSSDEGRVQMSAAAFAKGLLDLEGELTPILVSLVGKKSSTLDGLENASTEIGEAKARLNDIIMSGSKDNPSNKGSSDAPWMSDGVGIPSDAFELLQRLVQLTKEVTEQVRLLSAGIPCGGEGLVLMRARWEKLEAEIYNECKRRFEISKISDIYDSCKYDLLHNVHLKVGGLVELFKVSQSLADGVIPNEFGINPKQKLKIGRKVAHFLLGSILLDLRKSQEKDNETSDEEAGETVYTLDPKYADAKSPGNHVRTRIYFTSESHIHSLLNVLRYCHLDESLQGEDGLVCHSGLDLLHKTKELDYMSGIILRMFENAEVPSKDPKRFRIEMSFSRGADISPLENDYSKAVWLHQEHTLRLHSPECLQEVGSYLTLSRFRDLLTRGEAGPSSIS